jgi:hypothetical protein
VGRPLTVDGSHAELRPDTDATSIEPVLAAAAPGRRVFLQFSEPLPAGVLAAAAAALRQHPRAVFRAYGREIDPGLSWLEGFEFVEHLQLDVWHATSFDVLATFTGLRSLSLGETGSSRPSLAFLRQLRRLSVLWLEAHSRDFDAIADVPSLTRLGLRVPRVKNLDPLRGHPGIEAFTMVFGGIRDLSPLTELPRLRGLQLDQVRGLDADDLDSLGECRTLEALSLGALRNVDSLRALARRPARTLRLLSLEKLSGLTSLADLTGCEHLEELRLYESRPADKRLDVLLNIPSLRHLFIGDVYPAAQVSAIRDNFRGETLRYRRETLRGHPAHAHVRWRQPVHAYLGIE